MCMTSVVAAPAVDVAALVNGQKILLEEIDAPSHAKIATLREELTTLARRTIDRLVDARLRTQASDSELHSPAPAPVTEDEIRDFRKSRAEDFEGPFAPAGATRDQAVEHAAIRHYLEHKAREAAEAEARRRLRHTHKVEILLPEASALEQPLPPRREVARIGGAPIRAAKFEQAAALALYRLRGELYHERRRNLEAAIEDLLITQEARRRGISKQRLLAETTKEATVSDEEVRAFIETERAAGRSIPTAERARPYLKFRKAHARRSALLDKLRANAHIEILLKEPATPRLPVVEAGAPALGPPTGPRLIVYTNYRCTPCRAVHREVDRLRHVDPTVRVVFRDFIPAYDPVASEAARLSRCAAQLGAFERMRSELLGREPPAFGLSWYQADALPSLAGKLGIAPSAFMQCLSSAKTREVIERDTAHARELGFEEAPAFVADGVPLSGMQSAKNLARALQQGHKP